MNNNTQHSHHQPTQHQSIYNELEHIDEALHRLKTRLVSISENYDKKRQVLIRTGGALRNKYSAEEVLAWQKKIRDEWSA